MVAPPHNHMQMVLPALGAQRADPRLENLLGLVDELPVQVERVRRGAVGGVVLAEYVGRGLRVVLLCEGLVALAFFGEGVGRRAVVGGVRLVSLFGGRLVWGDSGAFRRTCGSGPGRSSLPFCCVRRVQGRGGGHIRLLRRSSGCG